MIRSKVAMIAVASVAIVMVGCEGTADGDQTVAHHYDDDVSEELPAVGANEKPMSWADGPSLCTWTHSVDATVVGELVEVTHTEAPMVSSEGDPWVTSCGGWVNDAFRLTLAVEEVVGEEQEKVVDDAGQLVVHGGHGHLDSLTGLPQEGQRVGMAVHQVPEFGLPDDMQGNRVWSLMGELMFQERDDDGSGIEFQQVYARTEAPPTGVEGKSVEEVQRQMDDCESTEEAEQRREWVWEMWGPGTDGQLEESGPGEPLNYLAAHCVE